VISIVSLRADRVCGNLPLAAMAPKILRSAQSFVIKGCRVVCDGFIPPGDLPRFTAAAGLSVLRYAVILPPVTTCTDRVTSRAGHGFTSVDATRPAPPLYAGSAGRQVPHH
jgi:hypothetical protein